MCVVEFFPIFSAVFSVPAAAGGAAAGKRRHSYQSGVPGLAKDMDRLRVSAAAANAGGNQGQGRSPRGSTRRRASSARRSSRSGKNTIIFHCSTLKRFKRISSIPDFYRKMKNLNKIDSH